MNTDKINLLITEAITNNYSQTQEWVKNRMENNLTQEELNYLAQQSFLFDVSKILYYESVYLSEEEIAHRISQLQPNFLDVPKIMSLVVAWSENAARLKNLPELFKFTSDFI